tara:strand:- start:1406 stop:1603 length:198 start_codon:yes stop_codon:yes gene_type:complete
MTNLIFAIPLNLGLATWSVIGITSIGFLLMFGLSSALGDFQGLINTTLENDAKSRANRKNKNIIK